MSTIQRLNKELLELKNNPPSNPKLVKVPVRIEMPINNCAIITIQATVDA